MKRSTELPPGFSSRCQGTPVKMARCNREQCGVHPDGAIAREQIVELVEAMMRLLAQTILASSLDPVILLLQEAHDVLADQAVTAAADGASQICLGGLAGWQARAVAGYIDEHLSERPSLRDMARSIGLSASHFARAFRQTFRMTPMQYARQMRLERAKRMIRETNMPLREVALNCGYSDQAHLSREFSGAMASSPRRWRRMVGRSSGRTA